MDYNNQINDLIQFNDSLTVNSFALINQIDINKSKEIINNYKEMNSNIHCTYLFTGLINDNQSNGIYTVLIAKEENKNEIEKRFNVINSCEIYSIEKSNSVNLYNHIQSNNSIQINEILSNKSVNNKFFNNSYGGIAYEGIDIKPLGQIHSSLPVAAKPIVKESPEEYMSRMFNSSSSSSSSSSSNTFSSSSATNKKVKAESFFKVNNKPKDNDSQLNTTNSIISSNDSLKDDSQPVSLESPVDVIVKEVKSVTTSGSNDITINPDEDEEWDDGTGYKTDTKRLLKRRNAPEELKVGKEDSEEVDEDFVDITNQNNKSNKRKEKKQVFGAIDSYIEDLQIKKENENNSSLNSKKTKRKLVEKMFSDDKGYLVTEMVWEEVTDNEDNIPIKPIITKTTSNGNVEQSKPVVKKTTTKKTTSVPSNQRSMTSFFTKK